MQPLLPPSASTTDSSTEEDTHTTSIGPVASEGNNIVVYSCCNFPGRRRQRRLLQLNHNVFLNLTLMITYGIGEGLWGGAVFAAYLKQLYHGKNAPFGRIEAVYSIAELVFAIPIGYLADRHGRSKIIKAGAVLFLVTALFHVATTYWLDTHPGSTNMTTTILLMIIMGLWGIGAGVVAGPCEALFADSTLPGRERDKWYTYLEIIYLLATVLGPLLSLVIFQVTGSGHINDNVNDNNMDVRGDGDSNHQVTRQWSMKALVVIIYAGLAMEGVSAIIMLFFDDNKALDTSGDNDIDDDGSSEEESVVEPNDDASEHDNAFDDETLQEDQTQTTLSFRERYQWTIPYIMVTSELVTAAANGLSQAYYPLFLKDDCGMTPAQVQILYAVEPLFVAAMTLAAPRVAERLGRIETILLFYAASIGFFAAIPIFNLRKQWHLLVSLHILSSSFGDSIHPLEIALMADSLPRRQRARWMSVSSSLSGLHQSATAVLGGYLADAWGYRGNFLATCVGEVAALAIFALLLLLVGREQQQISVATTTTRRRSSSIGRYSISVARSVSPGRNSPGEEQQSLLGEEHDSTR
jgi:MFS family permease